MNVNEINFVDTDTEKIKSNVIAVYESLTDRTLAQGDPVRLFLLSIAGIIAQQKAVINFTGKMNLLAYAEGDYLDHLGVLVGTKRLLASEAQAAVLIRLATPQASALVIPKGTRLTAGDGIFFAITQQVIIPAGDTTKAAAVACTVAGILGNGYLPGQLKTIVDPIAYVDSIVNTTETAGGADIEHDGSYRNRIHEAPESFSCAGPDGAYLYYAKSASALIADVAVESTQPGKVEIIPLLKNGGIPGEEILQCVLDRCNDTKIRPLTDEVSAIAPLEVHYSVDVSYYIDDENSAQTVLIQSAVEQAVDDYIFWQKSKLGRDINPSELITRMVNAGAKRVQVNSPAFTTVTKRQVAVAGEPMILFGGVEDD